MNPALLIVMTAFLCAIAGCSGATSDSTNAAQSGSAAGESAGADLAAARRGFTTKLRERGPAPQAFQRASPPAGVQEVEFESGDLRLKAWVSQDVGDGKQRPAVVFLHGGWAFDAVDWRDAAPFVDAGFVVMMPMLRGENGNPGVYEGFYSEVDDAVAAGRFVSNLAYVDSGNVFVAGHSVGALLTVLTAMVPSNYKAAAALSGYLDMAAWSQWEDPARVIFDTSNPNEIRLRNPMAFAASLQIPLVLYSEPGEMSDLNAAFVELAQRAGKDCELVVVAGDHMSMVAPSVRQAIVWFRNQMAR